MYHRGYDSIITCVGLDELGVRRREFVVVVAGVVFCFLFTVFWVSCFFLVYIVCGLV